MNKIKLIKSYYNIRYTNILRASFSTTNSTNLNSIKQGSISNILDGDLIINKNKEVLLYLTKVPFIDKIKFHASKLSVLTGLFIFISKNPLYLTLPVALPIAVYTFAYLFIKYFLKIRERSCTVKEIWLDKTGKEIKVLLVKTLRHGKLEVNLPISSIYTNPNTHLLPSLNYSHFPLSSNNLDEKDLFTYWKKIYSIDKKYFIIHKYPIYDRFEVLFKVLNGKEVTYGKNTVYLIDSEINDSQLEKVIKELSEEFKKKLI